MARRQDDADDCFALGLTVTPARFVDDDTPSSVSRQETLC
jgi:hypothetical protein